MLACDYSNNFWGEQNLGYHRLYNNLKRNEDVVQELSVFVKERINVEDELLKFLTKNLNRVNTFISNKGAFADSWRLTRSTLELWTEIQTTLIKNLSDLSREILRYHDDMVKARKRIRDQDTIDAVNMAKETYLQRCNEMANLKQENVNTKELLKTKSKLTKAHEEYKMYVEKYGQVRENFEVKLEKAAKVFQEHDAAFLSRFKTFLCTFARSLDDSQSAISQVTGDYRQSLERTDVQAIMLKFVEEKGTGTDRPPAIQWSEVDDDIPPEFDIQAPPHVSQSAPSSSNSSAIVTAYPLENTTPSVNDLLSDGPWGANSVNLKSDSDSETSGHHNAPPVNTANFTGSSSYVPSAVSSLFGRQKIWRKKHASQSNLSAVGVNESVGDFSHSCNEASVAKGGGGGFLRRYRRSKNSECSTDTKNNVSSQEDAQSTVSDERALATRNPVEEDIFAVFGAHSLPSQSFVKPLESTSAGLSDVDSEGYTIRKAQKPEEWSSHCSSSDEEVDEVEFQASKIKSLQIKPVDESSTQINSSVDELRNAIEHISLQKSSTFDKDPWGPSANELPFSQSLKAAQPPLRAAFTGDDFINRKFSEFSYSSNTMPSANLDFSRSTNLPIGTGGIARARPRAHTPNPQMTLSSSNLATTHGVFNNSRKDSPGTFTPFDNSMSGSFGSLVNISGGWLPTDPIQHSNSPLPFNESSSTVSRCKIPVAMGINEYIHAMFKPSEPSKPSVKVFGVIMVSFPASFVAQLTEDVVREPLKFSLKSASQIRTVQPHKKLITDFVSPSLPQETLTFTVNKQSLANWVFEQQQQKPNAEFFNVDLVRYELDDTFEAPLLINSYWKIEEKQTDIRIDYSLNTSDKTLTTPLININFDACVSGTVESYNSDPSAKWNAENKTLSFTLTELTRHGGSSGSLKARMKLSEGSSVPADTIVSFQTSNTTASNVVLQLDSEANAYQLNLVRKKSFRRVVNRHNMKLLNQRAEYMQLVSNVRWDFILVVLTLFYRILYMS